MLPSYRNQSTDLHSKSVKEAIIYSSQEEQMLQICRRKKLKDQMELCDIAILKRLFLTLKDCQKLACV